MPSSTANFAIFVGGLGVFYLLIALLLVYLTFKQFPVPAKGMDRVTRIATSRWKFYIPLLLLTIGVALAMWWMTNNYIINATYN